MDITGIVLDAETNLALRGVSVEAEGALYGTISNNAGQFRLKIDVSQGEDIVLSRVGYEDQRLHVSPTELVYVRMKPLRDKSSSGSSVMLEADYTLGLVRKLLAATTWPNEKQQQNAPLVIGIMGHNPFGQDLFAFEEVMVKGRPVEIRFLSAPEEIADVQALIVCRANPALARAIESQLGGKPVASFFYQCGSNVPASGLFTFRAETDKIVYHLNPEAAATSGLSFVQAVYQLSKP